MKNKNKKRKINSMRKSLLIPFFLAMLVTTSSIGFARNFIVYNVSNPSQTYFIVNGQTGYVGIGTNTPGYPLDVVGNARISNNLIVSGYGNLGSLQIGGVEVIDSSRNLKNINAVAQSLVPSAHNTYDLGSDLVRWKNAYFAGNLYVSGTIYGNVEGGITSNGDLNMNGYSIYNANDVNATRFFQNGVRVVDTITAGNGLSGGGNGPSVTLNVNVNTNKGLQIVSDSIETKVGTGLTYDASGNIIVDSSYFSSNYIDEGQAAGGDLSGTYPNPTVVGIRGIGVSSTTPAQGQALVYDGSQWSPAGVVTDSDVSLDGNNRIYAITIGGNSREIRASDVQCTNCISLGSETTGDYVAGVNAGTGIVVTGSGGEGSAPQISVDTSIIPRKNVAETITGSWTFNEDVKFMKNIYVAGNISYVNSNTLNVNGSIIPPLDDWFDIGASDKRWRNGYFSGTVYASTIQANNMNVGAVTQSGDLDMNNNNILHIASAYFGSSNNARLYWDGSNLVSSKSFAAPTIYQNGKQVLDTSTTFSAASGSDITITGSYNSLNLQIKTGAVGSDEIADDSITSSDIAANAITASELANNAVDTAAIQDGAVTSAKIADGTITNADINDNTKYVSIQDGSGTEQFTVLDGNQALQFAAGNGITINFDAANHRITINDANAGSELTGSGTDNYIAKFTGTNSLGVSQIIDDGTDVKIEPSGDVKIGI